MMSQVKTHAIEVQKKMESVRQAEQEVARQPEEGAVRAVAQAAYRRAQVNSSGLRAADLLALQRTVGNRRVQQVVARHLDNASAVPESVENIHRKSLLQMKKEEADPPGQKEKDVGDPLNFKDAEGNVGWKVKLTNPGHKIVEVTFEITFAKALTSFAAETKKSKGGSEREFQVGELEFFQKLRPGVQHELELTLVKIEQSEELVPGLKMYGEVELGKINLRDLDELNLAEFKFGFEGDITKWVNDKVGELRQGITVKAKVYGSIEIEGKDLKKLLEMVKRAKQARDHAKEAARLSKKLEEHVSNAKQKTQMMKEAEEKAKQLKKSLEESLERNKGLKPPKGGYRYKNILNKMSDAEKEIYKQMLERKEAAKAAEKAVEQANKTAKGLRNQIKTVTQKADSALKQAESLGKKLTGKFAKRMGGVIFKTVGKAILKVLSGIGILLGILEAGSLLKDLLTGKLRFGFGGDDGDGEGKAEGGEEGSEVAKGEGTESEEARGEGAKGTSPLTEGAEIGGSGVKTEEVMGTQPSQGTLTPSTPSQTSSERSEDSEGTTAARNTKMKLLDEVRSDKNLNRVYEKLIAKTGIIEVSEEFLRAYVELKSLMKRHPKAADKILTSLKPGKLTEPLNQIIEPMKQILLEEEKKLDADWKKKTGSTSPSTVRDLEEVTEINYARIEEKLKSPNKETSGMYKEPPPNLSFPVILEITGSGAKLTYEFSLDLVLSPGGQPSSRKGYEWVANYQYEPPAGIIKTAEGDRPIRFIGGGTFNLQIGFKSLNLGIKRSLP